jgi:hypothetical protein
MNHHVRRGRDTFIGIKAFGQENAADVSSGGIEAEQFTEIDDVLAGIELYVSQQMSGAGDARFSFNTKGIKRELMRADMRDISDIAGSMAYKISGIDLLFHVAKNLPDAEILALAKAFYAKSADYEADFKLYGLHPNFRANLLANIQAFQDSFSAPNTAVGKRVEATAMLDELLRRGMVARRILNGILKVKYKNNPPKWREWLAASHIDKSPLSADENLK